MEVIEYNSRDKLLTEKIKGISLDAKPEDCYTCLKCTNGCPASKIFEDFAPHKFQIAAHMGFADEIIESGILWYCFNCLTCQTRCPMLTSPNQTICSLNNIAVDRGIAPPKVFVDMIRNISNFGAIAKSREVPTVDFEFIDREELELPKRGVKNIESFQDALREIGVFSLLENKPEEK
ncbi:MAG: 4Fe-4S dicluster domain-containing protein [Candidatus Thorarchaeota archaeon]